jgi:chromate reductase
MNIVGIPGSLRRESFNRKLLLAAALELPPGVTLEVWDGLGAVPPFNEDDDDTAPVHPAVAKLRSVIEAADAVFIATPEYNGSLPGQLKNALDWASRPRGSAVLQGKRVATASASPTPYGAAWAQETLRKVLSISGADVTGGELVMPQAFQQFDLDGRLADPQLRDRLAQLIAQLVDTSVEARA